MITIKNRLLKNWVNKGTEISGEFDQLWKTEGIQVYYTMSETKAAFADHTIRCLKIIPLRYMGGYGYKYTHNLTQTVTKMISTRNSSIDLIPKNGKKSDFLSLLYSETLRGFREPKFKIGDRIRILKYDLFFRKGKKPKFTQVVFKIIAISSRKPLTYTKKDEQDEIIHGKFYQKS